MPDEGTSVCVCCKMRAEPHKLITCCICKDNYLHSCVDLTTSEIRTIKTKGKGLTWTCKSCLQVGSDINELKAAIISLRNEFSKIKQQTIQQSLSIDDDSFEEVLQEVQDRDNRRYNIIIYGVPESLDTSATVRSNYDQKKVSDILSFLSVQADATGIHRLGIFDPTKSTGRAMKIVFERGSINVHDIIRKAQSLNKSDTFRKVKISLDRTQRQIKFYKSVKDKLNERLQSGETDLSIKYVRGVPKIVSLNK